MRVTNGSTIRNFMNNYNSSSNRLNKLMNQATSWRKFDKVSEDTASASKAFIVRRQLSRNEMYKSNLTTSKDLLSSAETSAMNVSASIKKAITALEAGLNGPTSQTDRDIYAGQLESYRDEIIKSMNNNFSGRYLFGSTSNEAPFALDVDGELTYNGTKVSTLGVRPEDFPQNKDVFVDIGIGLKFDAAGEIDPQSALKISTSGIDFLGYGLDADGLPNNVCDALTKMAELLREPNVDTAAGSQYLGKLNTMQNNVLIQVADIGNRVNFIEFNVDRLAADTLNLQESQNNIETENPAKIYTKLKVEEAAYNACLQMGPRLIQPSLFDYMR